MLELSDTAFHRRMIFAAHAANTFPGDTIVVQCIAGSSAGESQVQYGSNGTTCVRVC